MEKVIKKFKERHQNHKLYEKGDTYTYENEERIAFLIKEGFLQQDKEKAEEKPRKAKTEGEIKHTGGGWYELPDGEKVKGKENALAALEESGE